jgi:hypothetical protein
MTTDFDAYQRACVRDVGGFGGPKAQMWFGFTGRYKDAELQKLRDWRAERYPDTCGDDALPLVASTFSLQKLDAETQQQWRGRLSGGWAFHKLSGTEWCLQTILEAAGWQDVIIDEGWEFGNWGGDYYSKVRITAVWPGFAVTLQPQEQPFQQGHNVPREALRELARLVRKLKSAQALPFELFVLNEDGTETATIPLFPIQSNTLTMPFEQAKFEEFV